MGRIPSAVGYQPTLATDMGQMQERITTTKKGSITSVQAIYVPADDLTDPSPATTFSHVSLKLNPSFSSSLISSWTPPLCCPVPSPSWASTPPSTHLSQPRVSWTPTLSVMSTTIPPPPSRRSSRITSVSYFNLKIFINNYQIFLN